MKVFCIVLIFTVLVTIANARLKCVPARSSNPGQAPGASNPTTATNPTTASKATTASPHEITLAEILNEMYLNGADPVLVKQYEQDLTNLLVKKTSPVSGSSVDNQAISSSYSQALSKAIVALRAAIVDDSFSTKVNVAENVAYILKDVVVYVYDLEIVQQLSALKLADDPNTVQFLKDYGDITLAIGHWPINPSEVDAFYTDMAALNKFSDAVDEGIALASRTKA